MPDYIPAAWTHSFEYNEGTVMNDPSKPDAPGASPGSPGRIGPWLLFRRLGQGGMGTVFEGVHETAQTRAAVKVIHRELASDPRYRERFQREAKLGRSVSHGNVVACLDAGEDQGRLYLALELVTGGSLADKVQHTGLPWREVARIGAEIARGLEALHAAGIVHRDLKPVNVLLAESGEAKVSDFGVAHVEGLAALTRTGELLGTVEYMAPEQSEGGRAASARTDLYALGCTLYDALLGRPPFPGSGPQVIVKHLTAAPEPLRGQVADLPEELERIVLQLLEKDPSRRGESAAAVASALEALATSSSGASKPARRLLVAGLAGAFVLSALLLGVGLRGPSPAPPPVETRREPSPPPPAPSPSPPPSPPRGGPAPGDPFQAERPGWFLALEKAKRPRPTSLPPGVYYDKGADGVYWHAKSRTELVFVPGGHVALGPLLLGAEHTDALTENRVGPDRPPVDLAPFFLGKYELSNEQFRRFVDATGYRTEPEKRGWSVVWQGVGVPQQVAGAQWRHPSGPQDRLDPECPVVDVAWQDARSYVEWAELRLPTEEEWECGAAWNGQAIQSYPWGDDEPTAETAEKVDILRTSPHVAHVTAHPAGVSPWGAFNMAGNVREWVDATAPNGEHLAKGGSFNEGAGNLRPPYRSVEGAAANNLGFRVALTAESPK
jgi:serine/threonine protein kinase